MAGYGNRTAPNYTTATPPAYLSTQHAQTRFDLPSYSTPTYSAGFGNKRASLTPTTSGEKPAAVAIDEDREEGRGKGGEEEPEEKPLRFDTQKSYGSAPYSNAHTYGSASTAGAGYGNKTGSFSGGEGGTGRKDSTLGKVIHKMGDIVHSPALTNKGRAESEDASAADGQDAQTPLTNGRFSSRD